MLKCSRKAQIELIGLIMIVVLLSLGMLFFLQFGLLKDKPKNTFTQKQIAAKVVNAILLAKIPCNNADIEIVQLFKKEFSQGTNCGMQPNYDYANKNVELALNKTLKKWGKNYQFLVYSPIGEKAHEIKNGDCLGDRDTFRQPITLDVTGSTFLIELHVCEE